MDLFISTLNKKRPRGMKRKRITELANTTQEVGKIDSYKGTMENARGNGTRTARAINAFASAPPKISRNWKNKYINPIMIGIKIKSNRFVFKREGVKTTWTSKKITPRQPIINQSIFGARLVFISV